MYYVTDLSPLVFTSYFKFRIGLETDCLGILTKHQKEKKYFLLPWQFFPTIEYGLMLKSSGVMYGPSNHTSSRDHPFKGCIIARKCGTYFENLTVVLVKSISQQVCLLCTSLITRKIELTEKESFSKLAFLQDFMLWYSVKTLNLEYFSLGFLLSLFTGQRLIFL